MTPTRAPKKFKLTSPPIPESAVLRSCLSLLRSRRVLSWRNNTGAFKTGGRFIRFGTPGSSDILGALPDGRFFACECKRPGERPSELQYAFLRNINACGGVGVWVTSSKQLSRILDAVLAGGSVRLDEAGRVVLREHEENDHGAR